MQAYNRTFRGTSLPNDAFQLLKTRGPAGSGSYGRAQLVAARSKVIVFPLSSADACLVIAYNRLKCQEVYNDMAWLSSVLILIQREWPDKYVTTDFDFWVKYGSWSCCDACGSFHFNAKYFRDTVYHNSGQSNNPELVRIHHQAVPADPKQHSPGHVGVSSRWWYLPGM